MRWMNHLAATMLVATTTVSPGLTRAADSEAGAEDSVIVYTFVINSVSDGVDIPLIGFVNIGRGSHRGAHIGFVNSSAGAFQGVQVGFVNTAGLDVTGVQAGFINIAGGQGRGPQVGFVNSTGGDGRGAQVGFLNSTGGSFRGPKIGFVNTTSGPALGPNVGFVNTATDAVGLQVGFINATRTLRGVQLGFVNSVESIEGGFPLGFVSVVRQGGYRAFELAVTETHPLSASFKLGIPWIYTSFVLALDPGTIRRSASGLGIGSVVPLTDTVYFNPEIQSSTTFEVGNRQFVSLTPAVGFRVAPRLDLVAGPSVVWSYSHGNREPLSPWFQFGGWSPNERQEIFVGFKLALRVTTS